MLSKGETITRDNVENDPRLQLPDAAPYVGTWEILQQGLLYQVLCIACRQYTSARQIAQHWGSATPPSSKSLRSLDARPVAPAPDASLPSSYAIIICRVDCTSVF